MFKIRIETKNAAFEDKIEEVKRTLKDIIKQLDQGYVDAKIYDINGNPVGKWMLR